MNRERVYTPREARKTRSFNAWDTQFIFVTLITRILFLVNDFSSQYSYKETIKNYQKTATEYKTFFRANSKISLKNLNYSSGNEIKRGNSTCLLHEILPISFVFFQASYFVQERQVRKNSGDI